MMVFSINPKWIRIIGNPLSHLIDECPAAGAWHHSCHQGPHARLGFCIAKVNPVRNSLCVILLSAWLALPSNALGQSKKDDQWENLKQITRHRTYMYIDRRLHCGAGMIAEVSEQAVTLKRADHTKITIERQDLLRFGELGLSATGIIFSGRSSWSDVRNQRHSSKDTQRNAWMRVVTVDGKNHEGQLTEVDDAHLALLDGDDRISLARTDISKVYHLRFKPYSDRAEYVAGELPLIGALDPEVLKYELNFTRIPVLLYDSSLAQDENAIECSKD
jgi:hypothetical protein